MFFKITCDELYVIKCTQPNIVKRFMGVAYTQEKDTGMISA